MIDWWLELVSHYFEIVFSWLSIIRRPGRVRYLLCIFMLRHFTGLSQCVGHNVVMVRCLGCTYSILFTQPPPGRRCKELPNTVANSSRLENTSILIDLFETFSRDIWTWYVRRIQVQKYLQHTKCRYCNTIDIVYYPSIWIYQVEISGRLGNDVDVNECKYRIDTLPGMLGVLKRVQLAGHQETCWLSLIRDGGFLSQQSNVLYHEAVYSCPEHVGCGGCEELNDTSHTGLNINWCILVIRKNALDKC